MFVFKKGGYLDPPESILATFDNLVVFIRGRNRKLLWNEFRRFTDKLGAICNKELVFWIDGSFVTLKRQPNDIDVVVFVHIDDLQKEQRAIYELEESIHLSSLIDLYIVPVYPEKSEGFLTDTLPQKAYWYKLFRRVKGRRFLKKGFIEVRV